MTPSLFDNLPTLPHNRTRTSRAAAQGKAATGTADTDRSRIAVLLLNTPLGMTRDEIADALAMSSDSVRPRAYELLGKCQRYLDRGGEAVLIETGETREWRHHKASKVIRHRRHVEVGP